MRRDLHRSSHLTDFSPVAYDLLIKKEDVT